MLTKFFNAVGSAAGGDSSDDLVRLYQRQRQATQRLVHRAMQLLTKSDLEQAAKALGMWQRGVIVMESEDVSGVLMNYALLELRHQGMTTVERFRADSSLYAAEDAAVVDVICRGQFRLLTLNRRAGDASWETTDRLTRQDGVLVDLSLGNTGRPGLMVATHVWDLRDGCWMTTGASVAYGKAADELVARRIRPICRCKLGDWPKLSTEQRSAVTALVIRCCLETGSADRLKYA